jgi:hypothetical protein
MAQYKMGKEERKADLAILADEVGDRTSTTDESREQAGR